MFSLWTGEYISFVMIVSYSLFFIFTLSVHSSLGYKDAVKRIYEKKVLSSTWFCWCFTKIWSSQNAGLGSGSGCLFFPNSFV